MLPVLNEAFENTKLIPKNVLADAGYKNESDFAELKAMRIKAYVAVGREGKDANPPKNEQCWRQSESDPPGSRNLTHPATGRQAAAKSAIEI